MINKGCLCKQSFQCLIAGLALMICSRFGLKDYVPSYSNPIYVFFFPKSLPQVIFGYLGELNSDSDHFATPMVADGDPASPFGIAHLGAGAATCQLQSLHSSKSPSDEN